MTDKPPEQSGPCTGHHGQCAHDSSNSHCTKNVGHDGTHHCNECGMDF